MVRMDFSLTEEQELFLTSLKELINRSFSEAYFKRCDETHTYPGKFLTAFVDSGMGLLGIPEEFGGVPADMLTQVLVLEEVARLGAPAYLLTVGQRMRSMLSFGSTLQLAKSAEASQDDLSLIQSLANCLNAEVGCSRPIAEGEHWLGRERYIGISGVMLKCEVYLALGISGQIQHMIGINDAKVVIAINKDKNAPIFQFADYGIVGDLYVVVPMLIEKLQP